MRMSDLDYQQGLIQYKIIILGMSSVGKTKLLTRYKYGVYQPTGSTTVMVDSLFIKTETAIFRYYDTAGQDRYKSIVDSYYRNSDACLIVYDSNSLKSFEEIPYYYNRIKELTPNSQIYIIGTKCDLQQKVSQQLVKKQYRSITNFLTSAKNGTNVVETFRKIQSSLLQIPPLSLQMKKSKLKPIKVVNTKDKKTDKYKEQAGCCQK